MKLVLHHVDNGPCPYLENLNWTTLTSKQTVLDERIYEQLLSEGFRRSGVFFYKNTCDSCSKCIPLRIAVPTFKPSKSQKRIAKRNNDVKIYITDPNFDEEVFELYCRYQLDWHRQEEPPTLRNFQNFLCATPFETKLMKYYADHRLIGAGWIDILPNGISSVYYIFDPVEKHRGLGTFSILREVAFTENLEKKYLYLGFWVKDAIKMSYKGNFYPHELLIHGEWQKIKKPLL